MKTDLYSIVRNPVALGLATYLSLASTASQPQAQSTEQVEISVSSSANSSAATSTSSSMASGYRVESTTDEAGEPVWRFFQGDRELAAYHADLEGTPGFYPLLSPSGLPLTRNFPMEPVGAAKQNAAAASPFERDDHPHHRSMWFDHGDVNGIDFWALKSKMKVGQVVQRSADTSTFGSVDIVDGNATAVGFSELKTSNDWMTPDGKRLLRDERTFRLHEHLGDTIMDVTVELIASDGDVTFGDTKEGSLGVRMAGTMKVDAKLGGAIHNADGLKDSDTWGKVSTWVDYSGPVAPADLSPSDDDVTAEDAADWERAGITMMYHPANTLPECYWHVRSYGLFAANPFGRHHFGQAAYDGVEIAQGDTLTLSFRLVLHDGAFDADKTKQHFEAYQASDIESLSGKED
ncbi:DUF6807 domain-containing protein [Allorhodopirellula solitaria]|uniref:Methane oxygenase PmoA n=1 Tax=Allorhodopirellula solitaria TaxID=2527987 RepID=A0A5C5XU24_9BACT|nr:PmoA family protein [Allorhodopirellula solitaria]TWT66394.1 hypothetical protein CA85_24880 [Allorhodopirellula solitaria]